MRCFVTGSTGFIGSHLVRLLLEHDFEVAVLIRSTSNPWRIKDILHRLHPITGDIVTIEVAGIAIRDFAPDIVFHLGWHGVSNNYRNAPSQVIQNLHGSLKLLELVNEVGCKRWIGLGSQAEYGVYNRILKEDSLTQPTTLYGTVKLCVGLLSQKLCRTYGIGFTWLRLTAAYGPLDDRDHMIPQVTLTLLRGKKPSLTWGEQNWDYLYVTDVAEAIYQVSMTPNAQGVFNLGFGQAYTVQKVAEQIRDLIDPSLLLGLGEVPYRPDQIMHLQADISRLKQATGWSPNVDLDEGLRRTVEWFKENRGRYER